MPTTCRQTAFQAIFALLELASSDESRFPPTLLFNEGWLLRLVLSAAERGLPCLPFSFHEASRWFSEALLCSAFLPRHRGDSLAESWTHADGVVGHFEFLPENKAGLTLDPTGSQFAVMEAKVFSGLSKGTKRAPAFDQAARNVACMAETLYRSGRPVEQWSCLAFCVLAPQTQIEAGVFTPALTKESIKGRIAARIAEYEEESRVSREVWFESWVCPLLEHIDIHCLDWESIIDSIQLHDAEFGEGLQRFYELTLKFNRRPPCLQADRS